MSTVVSKAMSGFPRISAGPGTARSRRRGRWCASDDQQMRADANQRWFRLEHPGDLQQIGAATRVLQPRLHVLEEPSGTFDPEEPIDEQAGIERFGAEIVRAVKIRRGEEVEPAGGVAVLPIAD